MLSGARSRAVSLLILLAVCVSLSNLMRQAVWIQELLSAFWVLIAALHLITLPSLVRRIFGAHKLMWSLAAVVTVYALGHYGAALYLFELSDPIRPGTAPAQELSIFYANKYYPNEEVAGVVGAISRRRPDVVLLLEADEPWIIRSGLRNRYPYHIETYDRGVWNIALYSRFPLAGETQRSLGEDVPPVIITRIAIPDGPTVPIAFVHLPPPLSQDSRAVGRYLARRLSTELRHSREPWIVAGDFNSGPFGRTYESFIDAARVYDASLGFGLFATWHTRIPFLRVTLDHLFVKPSISVSEFEKTEVSGSDHWGLFARVSIPAASGLSPN